MGFLRRAPLVAVAVAICALAASGCGGGSAQTYSDDGDDVVPGGGGELVYVVGSEPDTLDPLHASDVWTQTVARQIFEPLVGRVAAPYDRRGLPRSLAVAWRHSADYRVWTFVLRDGVRFQDGAAFDGQAVVANANRWRTDPAGAEAIPGLLAADAPRPDAVRLILSRQALDLPSELQNPRLGIVSPVVLRAAAGGPLARVDRAGTGPFELRSSAPETLLARSRGWWGTPLGLGPALDGIEFRVVPSVVQRTRLLGEGDAEVAPSLPATVADALRSDPLIAVIGTGDRTIAFQRSVRGINTWRPQGLSGAWLALLGGN